ncbi:response regulator transcription factor [Caulobacter sp. NIBR2454]|uniref:response regulator transcription factor n=1 Tax=Caulobacter sp. NIBR2454 TaxID=3015996 RepID=UPI0022B5F7D9|nr:response regulator [Caulobacter sp. NIBR2454]
MGEKSKTPQIVLVEDDALIAEWVQVRLRAAGFEVDWLQNGQTGLNRIKRSPPDLVLLDISMPLMDGFAVLRELRYDPKTKTVPVLMMTAQNTKADVERAGQLRANGYITKPFIAQDLIARVRKLIQAHQSPKASQAGVSPRDVSSDPIII